MKKKFAYYYIVWVKQFVYNFCLAFCSVNSSMNSSKLLLSVIQLSIERITKVSDFT